MNPREAFLGRVREAVAGGNRPGVKPAHPSRGLIGYQGADPDPATRFCEAFTAAGGKPYLVTDRDAAVAKILEIIRPLAVKRVLVGRGRFVDSLNLGERLRGQVEEILSVSGAPSGDERAAWFAADLSITGVDYLIAETGSAVVLAKPEEPRSLSLLPPVHIAVAERAQLVPDLFDLFTVELGNGQKALPSCVTLITGPSKTGDIELRLVTGVHGPGEIHVIVVGS
jgi:L-lactate utilization protein LutC